MIIPPLTTILSGAAVLTTATAPVMGNINRYNATSGALSVTLPALSGLNPSAWCMIEKYVLDVSANTVTFNCNGADTFDDGTTSLVIAVSGEKHTLQLIAVAGTTYWKRTTNKVGTSGTFSSPTISSPILSGTATGTYTLGGTP